MMPPQLPRPHPALPATSFEDWLAENEAESVSPLAGQSILSPEGTLSRSAQFPFGGTARPTAPPLSGAGAASVLTGGGVRSMSPGLEEYTSLLDALGTGGTAGDRDYRENVWQSAMGGLRRLMPGADREQSQDIATSRGAMREALPEVRGAREADTARQGELFYRRFTEPAQAESEGRIREAELKSMVDAAKDRSASMRGLFNSMLPFAAPQEDAAGVKEQMSPEEMQALWQAVQQLIRQGGQR